MDVLSVVWTIIKFIILISFLVVIHEGGHFLTAKAFGMKVNEFAVGFGPKIFGKQKGETLYSLRCIPLGGYCALEGEDDESDDPRAFGNKSVWARFWVVIMGATVNIVFALVVFFIMFMSLGKYQSTVVESFTPGSAGEMAGIQIGDEIYKINGKRMRTISAITEFLRTNKENEIDVTVKRDNAKLDFVFTPNVVETGYVGVEFKDDTTEIAAVSVDSPAESAEIKEKDRITKLNGKDIETATEFSSIVSKSANVPVTIEFLRNGVENTVTITPICPDILKTYEIGFYGSVSSDIPGLISKSFWQSLDQMTSMLHQVAEIFTGKVNLKYLSGPVGIAKVVGQADTGYSFLYLLVFISLNLGIVNLLPIPPLDGGKLVFILIEGIIRKKPNPKIEMYLQLIGMGLLVALMVFVTFNDITRRMSIF